MKRYPVTALSPLLYRANLLSKTERLSSGPLLAIDGTYCQRFFKVFGFTYSDQRIQCLRCG
jgi:hypothetical protein